MRKPHSAFFAAILVILIILTLGGLTWVNFRFAEENNGANDFLARWMGARSFIQEGKSPYEREVSQATQREIYGRLADTRRGEEAGHFLYPFTAMVFFAPFGMFEYPLARALWMTVLEVSLFLLALVSLKLVGWQVSPFKASLLVVFAVLWYPGLRGLLVGQFAIIEALLIVTLFTFIQRRQDFAAGLMLALAAARPQMAYLVVVIVLVWALSVRRREIVWGFLTVSALLLGLSLMFFLDWPLQWLRQLFESQHLFQNGSPITIIASAMPGIQRQVSLFLHGVLVAYLLVEWFFALHKDSRWFLWTFCLTLVITNLVTFRTTTANYVVLLPVLFLIFKVVEDRWPKNGRWVVWFFLLLGGLGLWWFFIVTMQGNQEADVLYLPLPIFSLLGLWWVRWWHLRPPRIYMDEIQARLE